MFALILAAIAAQPATDPSVDAAIQLCRPKLAEEVSADISAITATASSITGKWIVIRGSMSAAIRMGDVSAGRARTHHLGRINYDFICWVNDKSVRKITVNPGR